MGIASFVFVLLAAAALFTPRNAVAQGNAPAISPRVILVTLESCCRESACQGVEGLLIDELEATALDTSTVDGDLGDLTDTGAQLAARLGGDKGIALRLKRDQETGACEMELWGQSGTGAEPLHRIERILDSHVPDAAVNAAIATAEAVFAMLVEMRLISEVGPGPGVGGRNAAGSTVGGNISSPGSLGEGEGASSADAPPRLASSPFLERDRRLLGIFLGLCFVWSPGGTSAMGGVRLGFDVRPLSWLTLRLDGFLTVAGKDIDEIGARASFDAATFRVAAFYEIVRRGPVRPAIGPVFGGAVVWTSGVGNGDYLRAREAALAAYLGASGVVSFIFTDWFSAELGVAVGAVFPEVRVRFDGREVASFGRPLLDLFGQAEFSFL